VTKELGNIALSGASLNNVPVTIDNTAAYGSFLEFRPSKLAHADIFHTASHHCMNACVGTSNMLLKLQSERAKVHREAARLREKDDAIIRKRYCKVRAQWEKAYKSDMKRASGKSFFYRFGRNASARTTADVRSQYQEKEYEMDYQFYVEYAQSARRSYRNLFIAEAHVMLQHFEHEMEKLMVHQASEALRSTKHFKREIKDVEMHMKKDPGLKQQCANKNHFKIVVAQELYHLHERRLVHEREATQSQLMTRVELRTGQQNVLQSLRSFYEERDMACAFGLFYQ